MKRVTGRGGQEPSVWGERDSLPEKVTSQPKERESESGARQEAGGGRGLQAVGSGRGLQGSGRHGAESVEGGTMGLIQGQGETGTPNKELLD